MRKLFFTSALALGLVMGITLDASAQTIDWSQGSTNLFQGDATDDSFVSTNGISVAAYNATNLTGGGGVGADTEVNGVTFTAAEVGTTVTGLTGEGIVFDGGGNNEGAFGAGQFDGNAAVTALIAGGSFNIPSVTLTGLIAGQDYEIQTFVHDGRGSRSDAVTAYSNNGDDTGADALSVGNLNNSNTGDANAGGTGDSIIGTFTATVGTLTFNVFGDGNSTDGLAFTAANSQAAINAIQLRNVTGGAAIPEPSSIALIGLGAIGLVTRRRKSA